MLVYNPEVGAPARLGIVDCLGGLVNRTVYGMDSVTVG